jgi:phosphate transport system substrate-binding protein
MKASIIIVLLVLFGSCNRSKEPTATSGQSTIIVTESHAELLQQEASEFMRTYEAVKLRITSASTREAIVHLLNDSVQCICVDRVLNEEEERFVKDAGRLVWSTKIAMDGLVIVVNEQCQLKSISLETIGKIVTGQIGQWKQIPSSGVTGPIELILTGKNSGAYEILQRKFLHISGDMSPSKIGATQKEIVDYVGSKRQAMGIVSLAAVAREPKGIRMVAIESPDSMGVVQSVPPTQINIYRALYPLSYSLYLYVSEKRQGVGSGFSTFLMTTMGQKIVQDYGLVPERIPNRIIQLTSE